MRNSVKTFGPVILMVFAALLLFHSLSQTSNSGQTAVKKEVILMPGAKPSDLPFSPAVKYGNLLFLSGAIGMDPKTNELVSPDVGEQTKQCLERLGKILQQGGMDFSDAVRCTVYLTDIKDYAEMNKAYAAYFSENPPSRACVQIAGLVRGAKVEISMIAAK
jgi:2-iminobutanoate/2-iminopropanoate deaminase